MDRGNDMSARWLSIVGIGEDGRAGLSAAAIALVENAGLVIGGRRHLDLFGPTRGEQRIWPVPLDAAIPGILARRGSPVAVLASGDPFWYGAGVTLTRDIPPDEMIVVPSPSSLSLAAGRMGWALQDTVTLGLNMRGLTPLIRRHVHHGRRILALSLNGDTPREVAALLTRAGYGPTQLTVLESLGGPNERIRHTHADRFAFDDIGPLNIIAADVIASPNARPIPHTSGLDDAMFENDGQLTKREIRAITLSALAPGAGELLWDIGLGSGSIAIEWLLAHASNKAIGIERDAERAARAARNAIALGVPHLDIRVGAADTSLAGIPSPDAVFIGGGATPAILARCFAALKASGRLVANAVTLETEAVLLAAHSEYGGALTRISVERCSAVGGKHGWRPAMPVMQWAVRKQDASS
jgi:precorrin-6B C5,15-methyltransferase / cobalt-precorrin-6B C5,C15-methyltransferase